MSDFQENDCCNVNCDHSAHCVNVSIALGSKEQKRAEMLISVTTRCLRFQRRTQRNKTKTETIQGERKIL